MSDNYEIDKKWHEMKRLMDEIQPDIMRFVFKGNKAASIRTRNKLNDVRKLCMSVRESILKQRQDAEGDYDG